ncbi:MAG: hypothetical protein J1E80_04170 [Desulfovibrionaceae bacterium]|nr:hypothetical protein [Desulfovibrionaceae bacterium]
MAIFRCSMFGQIVYADAFTYQELLETEARVTAIVQDALEQCGAQHINFTGEADALLMECVFSDMDRAAHHALCDRIIQQLGSGVLGRFAFMDRSLDSVVFYFLGRGKWQEQAFSVPAPREALSGWMVRQERKPVPPLQSRRQESKTPAPAPEGHDSANGEPLQDSPEARPDSKNKAQAGNSAKKQNNHAQGATPD